jgi:PAS domain S-box-containing protein
MVRIASVKKPTVMFSRFVKSRSLKRSKERIQTVFPIEQPQLLRSLQMLEIDFLAAVARRDSIDDIFTLFLSRIQRTWPKIRMSLFIKGPSEQQQDRRYRIKVGRLEVTYIHTGEVFHQKKPSILRRFAAGTRRERKLWSETIIDSEKRLLGRISIVLPMALRLKRQEQRWIEVGAALLAMAIERDRVEIELQKQQLFLKEVLDLTPALIFAKDRAGKYVFVNKTLAKFYRTTPEECFGRRVTDFNFHKDECEEFENEDEEIFNSGEERVVLNQKVSDAYGKEHWMTVVKRPMYQKDGPSKYLIGVATDHTELRNVEEERRKLTSTLRDVERREGLARIAAGLAHDFNNLLFGIQGNCDLLHYQDLNSEEKESVQEIQKSVTTASALVQQLLYLSGEGPQSSQKLCLQKEMNSLTTELQSLVKSGVELCLDIQPITMIIDRNQLHQLIKNLFENARESFGHLGGKISIRTGYQLASEEYLRAAQSEHPLPTDTYGFLEISDSGCGIQESLIEKIFHPFFTTKPYHRGLGLAVVEGITRRIGGALSVSSVVGKGTSVRILFPRCE